MPFCYIYISTISTMIKSITFILTVFFLYSCTREENAPGRVSGYRPLYSQDTSIFTIESQPARDVVKAGKIYVKDNFIFQNEIGEGIHVIDNTNPAAASRVGFIKIIGSEELAIKGNFLYSNSFNDVVVVDISDVAHARVVNRINNAFNQNNFQLAPPYNGYFECVNNGRGTVIAWIPDTLNNPTCRK